MSEAIGRLISYILRLASPIEPRKRLKEVLRQLSGIGGGRSLGFGPNRIRSLPDGVAHVLDEYLSTWVGDPTTEHQSLLSTNSSQPEPAETPVQPMLQFGDLCPECGQATMVNEEGCHKCYTCGYSEC